jgi:hypothetical protein
MDAPGVYPSLTFHCNPKNTPSDSPIPIQVFQAQNTERLTRFPLEMYQALTLDHLQVLQPAKRSLLGDRENLDAPNRRGGCSRPL